MKKAGFTLVELMGVLIIIGVLSLIIIPVITNLIKEQKETQYNQQIEIIELASKNFGTDNLVVLPSADQEYMYVTLGQLKSMGYLENNIINPITEDEISNCAKVKITKSGNTYKYEYQVDSENATNCTFGNSYLTISEPLTNKLKNKNTAAYIITINDENNENMFSSYQINKNKIILTGDTDAKYSVVGGNKAFKIIVTAGEKDGKIQLQLDSGAIIKDGAEDLVGENGIIVDNNIIVDNTAPTIPVITFNNGYVSDTWTRDSVTMTYNSTDHGVNEIYYQFSLNNVYFQSTRIEFDFDSTKNNWTISWASRYPYYIRACDALDNCSQGSLVIVKIDNTAPTISSVTANECSNGNRTITVVANDYIPIPNAQNFIDTGIGISGYAITTTNSIPAISEFNNVTSSTWTSESYAPGTYYVWVKDRLDNISVSKQVILDSCNFNIS